MSSINKPRHGDGVAAGRSPRGPQLPEHDAQVGPPSLPGDILQLVELACRHRPLRNRRLTPRTGRDPGAWRAVSPPGLLADVDFVGDLRRRSRRGGSAPPAHSRGREADPSRMRRAIAPESRTPEDRGGRGAGRFRPPLRRLPSPGRPPPGGSETAASGSAGRRDRSPKRRRASSPTAGGPARPPWQRGAATGPPEQAPPHHQIERRFRGSRGSSACSAVRSRPPTGLVKRRITACAAFPPWRGKSATGDPPPPVRTGPWQEGTRHMMGAESGTANS